jgi:hypothetical protein
VASIGRERNILSPGVQRRVRPRKPSAGSSLPSKFYRKDASLPPEQRYSDGAPPEIMKFGSAWPNADFELIDKTTEIAPGIHRGRRLDQQAHPPHRRGSIWWWPMTRTSKRSPRLAGAERRMR